MDIGKLGVDTLILYKNYPGNFKNVPAGFSCRIDQDGQITKSYYKAAELYIEISHKGAFIEIKNVPRYLEYPHNLLPASLPDLLELGKRLSKEIREIDLNLGPVRELSISRLDIARNIRADHPFCDYIPIFENAGPSRVHRDRFPTTYTYGKNPHQERFYDKTEQLRKKYGVKDLPENIMRAEVSLKRKSELEKTGLSTFGLLIDKWDELPSIYAKFLSRILPERIPYSGSGTAIQMLRMVGVNRKSVEKMALTALMYPTVGKAALRQKLSGKHPPGYVSKIMREYDQRYKDYLAMEATSESTYGFLLEELRSKFLNM